MFRPLLVGLLLLFLFVPSVSAYSLSETFLTDTTGDYLTLNTTWNGPGNVTLASQQSAQTSSFVLVDDQPYVQGTNVSMEFTYVSNLGTDDWVGAVLEANESVAPANRISGYGCAIRGSGGDNNLSQANFIVELVGTPTTLGEAPEGNRYRLIHQWDSSNNLNCKLWLYDAAEPAGWNVSTSYSTSPSLAGTAWGAVTDAESMMYLHFLGYNVTEFPDPVAPVDPNSTLTVQANSTFDDSLVTGLCARITNSSFNSSGCNETGTDVYFDALTGNFSIGVYNVSVFSVGVGDGSQGNFSSNSSLNVNWSSNQTEQVFVSPLVLDLTFLDEETRLSLNGTNVSVSVIDSLGNITDFITDTGNITISGIFVEGDYTVRFTAENYSLRNFFFTLSLDDPTTSETLYLLRDSVFTPGVVEVFNSDGSVVEGASVVMSRYYGNDSIPNQIQSGTTDSQGNVVFVAESVTAFYEFSVLVGGILEFADANPELLVVDADGLWHKTIILDREAVVGENTGFLYSFSPQGPLFNGSGYNFTFDVSSSVWNVSSCSVELRDAGSGSVLNSSSGFCNSSGGSGVVFYSVSSLSSLLLVASVVTDEFTNTYSNFYGVVVEGSEPFTLKVLFDDLSGFSGSGFGSFARFFIALVVIFGLTFALAGSTNLINNPEEMLLLMFVVSLGFSYLGWLTVEVDTIPENLSALKQWFLSVLLGFFALFAGFRKSGVTS